MRVGVIPAATYAAVHHRLIRTRGPARLHVCWCGRQALDWAYRGGDPDERVEETGHRPGMVFSPNLDAYEPLCRSCHRAQDDRGEAAANGRAGAAKIAASARARMSTPEARARSRAVGTRSIRKTLAIRRRCSCGLVANPANLKRHLGASGHVAEGVIPSA